MAAFPNSVAFRSRANNAYLRLNHEEGQYKGFIQFRGNSIVNQHTRFEIERAESNPNLVHIRCVSNNKYWSANKENDSWLSATADKSEEDRSKWNCTLFEPRAAGAGLEFRFLHVQQGRFAMFMTSVTRYGMVVPLVANPDSSLSFDVFTLVDWESLVIMPRYISFKGNNDLFLTGQIVQNLEHLQFESPDGRDPAAAHEIYMNPDGSIRVRSIHFNKFWRLGSGNWILADTFNTASATHFWPFKLRDNAISLRCLGNGNFCNRLTLDGREDCYNAGISAMSAATELEVTELIVARSMFNTEFHLMDARIYDERVIMVGTASVTNPSDEETSLAVSVTVTETRSSTWSTSVSLMLGVTTSLTARVPLIAEASIELSTQLTTQLEIGRTTTTEHSFEASSAIRVPPRTSALVRALATSGTCDVPFSYTRTDVLWNGERETTRLDDGTYTGINAYNVHFEPQFTRMDMDKLYAAPADPTPALIDPSPAPADTAPNHVAAATVAD